MFLTRNATSYKLAVAVAVENFEIGTVDHELIIEAEKGKFQDFLQKDLNNEMYHTRSHYLALYDLLADKYFLKGTAAKQYLDYLELKESRITSAQARKKSFWSIIIAIGAFVISTILGAYSIYSSPKPPFDVKVIENTTRTDELFKDNLELKQELYEAEMLMQIYEGESYLN